MGSSRRSEPKLMWLLDNPEDVHHAFMRRMVKAVSTMCDDEGDIWKIVLKFQEGPDVHLMAHGMHTEGFIDVYEER